MEKSKKKKKGAGTGQILFTGPNGIGNYRPRRVHSPQYVGPGPWSPEAQSNLAYLWRAAPHAPPPSSKQAFVGEVGWCWQYSAMLNDSTLRSGAQIRKSAIRLEVEDRAKNKFLELGERTVIPEPPAKIVFAEKLTYDFQDRLISNIYSNNSDVSSYTI
ncbi:uncharacterized protein C4orf45 [Corythoichthys intestinalis]|uniref:uncharacterized protein C4orf45 n=1 Tax=Corythoichthys intestinalis TaxID=161448 RepID=UPI0025A5E9DD|nr:uncharacterized protein C4orf45 [Corythoichthys intestinalis]